MLLPNDANYTMAHQSAQCPGNPQGRGKLAIRAIYQNKGIHTNILFNRNNHPKSQTERCRQLNICFLLQCMHIATADLKYPVTQVTKHNLNSYEMYQLIVYVIL